MFGHSFVRFNTFVSFPDGLGYLRCWPVLNPPIKKNKNAGRGHRVLISSQLKSAAELISLINSPGPATEKVKKAPHDSG